MCSLVSLVMSISYETGHTCINQIMRQYAASDRLHLINRHEFVEAVSPLIRWRHAAQEIDALFRQDPLENVDAKLGFLGIHTIQLLDVVVACIHPIDDSRIQVLFQGPVEQDDKLAEFLTIISTLHKNACQFF